MGEWKFPHGVDLTPTGHNNTAIEMFLDNIIDSLTREVLQNSLDAHNPELKEPVIVKFDFTEISNDDIPGVDEIKEALSKAIEMWEEKDNEDTLNYLSRFRQVINQNKVDVLKISDFNTKGLNDRSYDSLIVGSGYSQKDSESSAGSKGIGKAAPFAASDLRMVFYNTVPIEGDEKSAGIMNFVSYYWNKSENEITQERASYVDEGKTYMEGQFSLGFQERGKEDFGTDLFIIGLKTYENWQEKIILSTINNFLLSVFKDELRIEVQGKELNAQNLEDTLNELQKADMTREEKMLFENTLRYYDVITNEDSLTFNLDERFKNYDFIESFTDGKLILLNHEPANRTILQTRRAGMKIYERNRISGNINFSGVFQATGEKFNSFLKDMENANHNIWSTDRLPKEEKSKGDKLLKDLFQWYKQMVKESYEKESEKEVEAFGVSDLLPLQGENEESEKNKDSGIQNKISNISIVKKTETSQIKDGDKEEESLIDVIDETENGPGDTSGGGVDRTGGGGGGGDIPSYGGKIEPGDSGGEGKKSVGETKKLVGPSDKFRIKIVELNSAEGLYHLIGIPNKRMKKVMIELKYVGADGKSYSIKILNADSPTLKAELVDNNILVTSIGKNQNFKVDIRIKSKLRMKMEAYIYEIKS